MSGGGETLEKRRARLLERAAAERDDLAGQFARWEKPLAVVDRGLTILRVLRRGAPLIGIAVSAALAALAVSRPNLGDWIGRGLTAVRLGRDVVTRVRR